MNSDINRNDFIRQVRYIGESLIKNAESIVGTEEYLNAIHISADIKPFETIPEISISRSFYPERYVDAEEK